MDLFRKAMDKLNGKSLGEIENPSDQPKDQVDLVDFIKGKVMDVRQASSRISLEGTWMTNYAYLVGYNSVYYDTNSRQFKNMATPQAGLRGNKLYINKILPTVQRRQARLCKNAPRYEVKPDNASQEAKDTARLEQQVIEMYWDKERINEKRLKMMTGLQQCGHYYMEVGWDTQKGEAITNELYEKDELGQIILDENGEPKKSLDIEYEGDLTVNTESPFGIFVDPLATSLEDAQWYIKARVRKLDYFKTHWGERGCLVKEEDAWLMSIQYEQRLQGMTNQGPTQASTQTQMANAAIELSYHEKRSKGYPNGRMIVCANGILLHDGELPVGEFPLVKFDDIPIEGKFYPEAIVTHLRPIQDQYNKLVTMRAAWTNRLLAGKYIAPYGSNLHSEALTDQSGEVVYFEAVPNSPSGVQPLQVPMIPSYAYEEEQNLDKMFYDIAGEGEISRGILPAAGIPAIGMQLLLEQDETRVAAMTEQHEYAFAKLARLQLMYLEKFCTSEKLLKISDPNAQYIVKKFIGADLKSKHDVTVVKGSLAPSTKASRRNDVMNLYQSGLLGDAVDPQVKAKVLNYLEFGDTSNVWQDQAIDMAQIRKTIDQIEKEKIPEVSELDNHVLHIQEKNKYRKSDKFDTLSSTSQAILITDIEQHINFLKQITAPQFGMSVNPEDDVSAMQKQNFADIHQASIEAGVDDVVEQEPSLEEGGV